MIRTRFAPSPTGLLHLGNARTALFSYLLARSQEGGRFILRIEDTDQERSRKEYGDAISEDLGWLGLAPDEGPDEGAFGPYRQSLRRERHAEAVRELLEKDLAYPCFCTPEELKADRDLARKAHRTPRYSGSCRGLSETQRRRRREDNLPEAHRFRVPAKEVSVPDLVRGRIVFPAGELDDFIIQRSDGSVSFLLAGALDDADMEITHVLRGDDHLANTPRQILLLEALGKALPRYAHLGLIMGRDGKPLSKRSASVTLRSLRDEGYEPEAVVAALARLGWKAPEKWGEDPLEYFAGAFRVEDLSGAPCVWDAARLNHENARALGAMSPARLLRLAKPLAGAWGQDDARLKMALVAVRPELKKRGDIPELIAPLMPGNIPYTPEALQALSAKGVGALLEEVARGIETMDTIGLESIKNTIARAGDQLGLAGRRLYQPLRAAISGRTRGLELSKTIDILGAEETARRLRKAAAGPDYS